jgi:ApeA N-terminal domain 1
VTADGGRGIRGRICPVRGLRDTFRQLQDMAGDHQAARSTARGNLWGRMKEGLRDHYEGRWWVPGQPKDAASGGALTLGGDQGGVLRLNGALPWDLAKRLEPRNRSGEWYDLGVINGESVDGELISLLKNLVTRTRSRLGGTAQSQELLSTEVLVGAHFGEADLLFDTVHFELTHLADWSRQSGPGPVSEATQEDNFVITYRRTPPQLATVPGLGEVALIHSAQYQTNDDVYTLRDYAAFAVRLAEPKSLDDIFDHAIAPLQNLLTFADMRPSRPGPVSVTSPGVNLIPDVPAALAVYRSGVEPPGTARNKESNPYRRIFVLETSPIAFDQLIVRWFELGRRLGPIIDLYLSLDYAPPVHTETRFINVCQAAEGYHRAVSSGTVMEPSEHREIVKALVDATPENRRDWVRGVLAHSNEPSFKRRIEELVDRAGPAVWSLTKARPRYAATMRDRRKEYAHWLSTDPPAESLGAELLDLISVTRFVLAACFLLDLGWSSENVRQSFEQNPLYRFVVKGGGRS